MPAGSKKSEYNPCHICGKPRGKGPHEFAHGKCAEIMAATEGKNPAFEKPFGRGSKPITVEQHKKSVANKNAKRYSKGKLPDWMYS